MARADTMCGGVGPIARTNTASCAKAALWGTEVKRRVLLFYFWRCGDGRAQTAADLSDMTRAQSPDSTWRRPLLRPGSKGAGRRGRRDRRPEEANERSRAPHRSIHLHRRRSIDSPRPGSPDCASCSRGGSSGQIPKNGPSSHMVVPRGMPFLHHDLTQIGRGVGSDTSRLGRQTLGFV